MSDSGNPSGNGPFGFFDDVLMPPEGGWGAEFDPLKLYDKIYPDWREGPPVPVDPLTEPMPTDPSLGSMEPEATTFPKGFLDITGLSEYMPSMADFDFAMYNGALQAHDRLTNGGQLAHPFGVTGQAAQSPVFSPGADDDAATPQEIPNAPLSTLGGTHVPQAISAKFPVDPNGGGVGNGAQPASSATISGDGAGTSVFDQPAVHSGQMPLQSLSGLQPSTPDALNQDDPVTAPFAPPRPSAPLQTSTPTEPGAASQTVPASQPAKLDNASGQTWLDPNSKYAKFFDEQYPAVQKIAVQLGVDPTLLIGLAALESDYGMHNVGKNNPFGATPDGTSGTDYSSLDGAWQHWAEQWGPRVAGVGSDKDAFLKNLELDNRNAPNSDGRGSYNSVNHDWSKAVSGTIDGVRKRLPYWM